MMKIAVCPVHDVEMVLAHRSVEMDAWHCDACGFSHSVTSEGQYVAAADPTGTAPVPLLVRWVERTEADSRAGRLTNWEGG